MNGDQNSPPYRLAFVDLDDTLLGPDKDISAENLLALERLRTEGVQVTIASGRHHKNITAIEKLGRQGWVLSAHGSVIRHGATGEVLAEATVDYPSVAQLSARAAALGFGVIVYHRDGAFTEQPSEWTDSYARAAGWIPQPLQFATLDPTGFQKVIWSGPPERIRELAPVLKAEFADRLNVLITYPELLEFFSPTANKAVGAQTLARKLQVKTAQTLAFGDGSNDVELLGWAGFSVAMYHGSEIARRAARFISPPGPPETAFARAVDLAFRPQKSSSQIR